MKILYLTDSYGNKVNGIKLSLFNELRNSGINITKRTIHSYANNIICGKSLIQLIKKEKYTHVFVAHTWASFYGCTLRDLNAMGVVMVGFGFSDPYDWNPQKLTQYNVYVTNSSFIYQKFSNNNTLVYFPNCCDLNFHKIIKKEKTTDILIIGRGKHQRLSNENYRIEMVRSLLKANLSIKIFGNNWGDIPVNSSIIGEQFIIEINNAKVGIDLQETNSPIARRSFEFPACGTPIITRARDEVAYLFGTDGMLTYKNKYELIKLTNRLLYDKVFYDHWKKKLVAHITNNHSIVNRVSNLLWSLEFYNT